MKSIKLIAIIFILLVLFPATVSAASYKIEDISKKEYVTGQYGKTACALGIGDCIFLITDKDGSQYYKLDRDRLLPGSIVAAKSQPSATINQGQPSVSLSYTIKGSGADGFNAHNQKYEWYDYYGRFINTFQINLPYDKEYVVIQKLASPPSPGGWGYTIIEFVEINIKNQNCPHLPCSPEYNQVWAKGDEFYPNVIVLGVATPTPTPRYTANPTPYPTYSNPEPTNTPQTTVTYSYPKPTLTPIKPKIIPKPIADTLGIKETPGFGFGLAIIGIIAVFYLRRKL
ncbi:MAG: hypothetical protein MPEBLZ_02056 [Candidatus Methanoperedens nitroreducens]|uniref:PGF-CTERM archaeal protein-sorting signal domain-containing protein n=1 Tax=Candidatus Methanoperedens nitratireducens TaxID=1392998 RepID=A0A0P8AGB1_9EURY|nr:MAG: hypothetical protein MPEBLZ_02056 [Candidatus Methanoperedens sp. BLZ1]